VTRFMWFGRLLADSGDPAFAGFGGVPIGAFQVSLVLRAAVLVICCVAWVLRREEDAHPLVEPLPGHRISGIRT